MDFQEEIGKVWYKSKTIVLNGIVAFSGIAIELANEFMPQLQSNLDSLKSVNVKWYILGIAVLGLWNAYNRLHTKEPILKVEPK